MALRPTATAADISAVVLWIGQAVSDHVALYDADAAADLAVPTTLGGLIDFASA